MIAPAFHAGRAPTGAAEQIPFGSINLEKLRGWMRISTLSSDHGPIEILGSPSFIPNAKEHEFGLKAKGGHLLQEFRSVNKKKHQNYLPEVVLVLREFNEWQVLGSSDGV